MGTTFAALADRGFARYLTGQFLGSTGTWMQRVAQDWLVLDVTGGSGVAVGITTALQFLPYLASPWAGLLADRAPRRIILMASQACVLTMSIAMTAAIATGHAPVAAVYLAALVTGIAAALDSPARMAVTADIVAKEHLVNAVSLNATAFHLARIVGPALAGILIATLGMVMVFVVIAVAFLLALLSFAGLPRARLRHGQDGGPPTMSEALAFLREHHELVVALGIVLVVSGVGMYFQLTTALMTRNVLGGNASTFGVMSSLLAVGAVAGALTTGRRPTVSLRTVVGAALAFAGVELMAGLMPTQATYGVMLVLCGAAALTFMTSAQSYVQLRSPTEVRGRMMGLYTVVFYAAHPLGAPLLGLVSDRFGPRMTLIGPGAVVAVGVVTLVAVSAHRRTEWL